VAVHLMLDFDDDEDAKKFIRDNVQSGAVTASPQHPALKAKVVGVWKKPTSFCNIGDGHRAAYLRNVGPKGGGWTRGRSYGWWVDPACKKPTSEWAAGNGWHLALGVNLLPPPLATEDKHGDERSPAIWYDVLPTETMEDVPLSKEG
jgi:hypothetical protein